MTIFNPLKQFIMDNTKQEATFDIEYTQSLYKKTTVTSADYESEVEKTEDGKQLNMYTNDINWDDCYFKQHYSPLELIDILKSMLESCVANDKDYLGNKYTDLSRHQAEVLIRECSNWKSGYEETMYEGAYKFE